MFFPRRFIARLCSCRASVGWLAAAWYLAVTLGVPISTTVIGGKDLSRPFLCMHSHCGCMNAEQCYRSCCCHTAAERLAFARQHGDAPPAELIAAAAKESQDAAKSCGKCCETRHRAVAVEQAKDDFTTVNLQASLACQGAGQYWLLAGAAIPPRLFEHELFMAYGAWLPASSVKSASVSAKPEIPPPRIG